MSTSEAILQHLKSLPDSAQREVLDFVQFLESRRKELAERDENLVWSDFSLTSAMRGIEDEETLYSRADIKESFS
jgi:hypothetical protein